MKNLSISSSETGSPFSPWGRIWMLAAAVFLILLAAGEGIVRMAGVVPSVRDRADLWSYWREQASSAGKETVVLLGGSRMLLDFNMDTWNEVFPDRRVIQLAVDGSSALPVLEDLASDPEFRGTILLSINMEMFSPDSWKRASWYVTYFHTRWSLEERIWLAVRTFLQRNLAVFSAGDSGLSGLLEGKPLSSYRITRPDRGTAADYAHPLAPKKPPSGNPQSLRWARKVLPEAQFDAAVRRTGAAIQKIQKRGGRVILVHFVNSRRHFPREYYWNVMVRKLRVPAFHFEDYPELRNFQTPDGSHLDYRDTSAYTRRLAEILLSEGALGG